MPPPDLRVFRVMNPCGKVCTDFADLRAHRARSAYCAPSLLIIAVRQREPSIECNHVVIWKGVARGGMSLCSPFCSIDARLQPSVGIDIEKQNLPRLRKTNDVILA